MTDPILKSLMILREDAHARGMVDVGEALDRSLRRLWAEHVQREANRIINLPILDTWRRLPFPKWGGGGTSG